MGWEGRAPRTNRHKVLLRLSTFSPKASERAVPSFYLQPQDASQAMLHQLVRENVPALGLDQANAWK